MYDSRVNQREDYWHSDSSIIYITIKTSNPGRLGSFVLDTMGTEGTMISSLTCEVCDDSETLDRVVGCNSGKPTLNLVVTIVDLRWWLGKISNIKILLELL